MTSASVGLVLSKFTTTILRTPFAEEVSSEEAVEIDENHDVHEHHGYQEVEGMIQ